MRKRDVRKMSLSKLKRIKFNERGIEYAKLDGYKIIASKKYD